MLNADRDAIYGRNSTDRQEKQQTIKTQLHLLSEKYGKDVVEQADQYLDEGWSGTRRERPALNRLLATCKRDPYRRVLIANHSRLARGRIGLRQSLEDELHSYGVEVVYLAGKTANTATGRAQDGMQSVFDEWQRETIVEAMDAGRDRRLAEGLLWRAVKTYGWRYIRRSGQSERGHLEVVEEEAEHIRWMYAQVIAGTSTYWVATELNWQGIKTVRGKLWNARAVQQTLHNPLHTGHVPINRWKTVEPTDTGNALRKRLKSSARERPESEWVYVELPESIVSVETWRQAKAAMTRNKKESRRNGKVDYLLRRLLRCGCEREGHPGEFCGRVLTGRTEQGKRRIYRCGRTRTSDPTIGRGCRGRADAEEIEANVWGALTGWFSTPEQLWDRIAATDATAGGRHVRLTAQLDQARARRAAAMGELVALSRQNAKGLLDDEAFAAAQAEVVREREQADEEIAFCQDELAAADEEQAMHADLTAFCLAAAEGLDRYTFEQKQRCIRQLVEVVWVYPYGLVKLECRVPLINRETCESLRDEAGDEVMTEMYATVRITSGCLTHNSTTIRLAGRRFTLVIAA